MEQTMTDCRLINLKEVSKRTNIGMNTLYHLSNMPGFPRIKLTQKKHLYDVEEVIRWLKNKTQDGEAVM